uniref:Uncharacterized protein n=2 Tax=Schizaphis graminum TaxID=13262 RepID=A0A2S2P6R2_SCHGA
MPSCKPPSDYLSVPDVRKKCYKIPPENELCLCEDIFQQHQAKLINCDVEDASAVESYKDPDFDSNENVCDGIVNNECCCGEGGGGDNCTEGDSLKSLSSSSSPSVISAKNERNNGATEDIAESRDKLTSEERDKVLRELEDIVTGNFLTKVRRFSQDVHSDSSAGDDHCFGGAGQLQLTSASAAARLRGKRSSSLDTDEIVNYGKVAELTRRFSRLGEIGVITPRHYRSEPDFFGESATSDRHFRHHHRENDFSLSSTSSSDADGEIGVGGVDVTSSGDDYEVVRQPIRMVFIRPMSVSDDRLNNRSGGVVLTEVTSDGETDVHQQQQRTLSNATQNRRRSFRKSVAFDSSLSSIDGSGGVDCVCSDDAAMTRYHRLKGGCQQPQTILNWKPTAAYQRAATVNYSKSSDTVSVSKFCRSHRRYSSVDVYDQVKNVVFLDVEKTEKEFRDGLLAEKNRRREAIRDYMANKELLLMKMKSASVGGVLRWNQEHQDTLLDDEEPPQSHDSDGGSSDSSSSLPPPKDGLRRVLRTGLKGRRIRRLRKLESRSSGFALADLWRVVGNKDVPAPSSSSSQHSVAGCCSSAEPPDNHNNSL